MNDLLDRLLEKKYTYEQRRTIKGWLRRHLYPARFGNIRRSAPLSRNYGYDRGSPVDRYYVDAFLSQNKSEICGRVLEIKDSGYTEKYGTGVTSSEILDIDPSNPKATLVADLSKADSIPAAQFDSFVFTQTLQLIYDFKGAIFHSHRLLRPGGVLLATVPGTSRIAPDWGLESEYWRFTEASCRRMFSEVFGEGQVTVQPYGNMFTSIAFLAGAAWEELSLTELDHLDPYFPVIIGIRAVRRPEA